MDELRLAPARHDRRPSASGGNPGRAGGGADEGRGFDAAVDEAARPDASATRKPTGRPKPAEAGARALDATLPEAAGAPAPVEPILPFLVAATPPLAVPVPQVPVPGAVGVVLPADPMAPVPVPVQMPVPTPAAVAPVAETLDPEVSPGLPGVPSPALPAGPSQASQALPQAAQALPTSPAGGTDPLSTLLKPVPPVAAPEGEPGKAVPTPSSAPAAQAIAARKPSGEAATATQLVSAALEAVNPSGNQAAPPSAAIPSGGAEAPSPVPRPAALHGPLPHPAEQFREQVVRVLVAGKSEFRIELTPPELGRVLVKAEIGGGSVGLVVQADRAETLDMIRGDMRGLERALGEAGLKLDTANLQFQLRGDDQPRGSGGMPGGAGEGGRQAWRGKHAEDEEEAMPQRLLHSGEGVVDVMV